MTWISDPIAWWIEPFSSNDFMRTALLAGLLVVASTSIIGTWVVLRGMSFLGDALAHGVLPGIAIAAAFGIDPTIGAFGAAVVMAVSIGAIRERTPLPNDVSIGVLFVGFLALAVVIFSRASGSYSTDLNRVLFGSITGVDTADLWRLIVVAVVVAVGTAIFYRAFLVMSFDETHAELLGLHPRRAHLVMLLLVTLAIVASFEVVGNLLVFGFLVAPPAAASLVASRVPAIMLASTGFGAVAVVLGLLVSYHHDTAASASMALASVVLFALTVVVRSIRQVISGDATSTVAHAH